MVEKVQANCGRLPEKVSADAGYFNTKQLTEVRLSSVDLYVSPDRQKHGSVLKTSALPTAAQAGGGVVGQMREKLKTAAGQAVYQWRKAIVEPVFGQLKEARGFRRFAFRGLAKVSAEWALICLTHNLLKLWRAKLRLFTG
jgi:IS5 family transposase